MVIDEYQKNLDKITEKYDEYTRIKMGTIDENTGKIIQAGDADKQKAEKLKKEIISELDKLGKLE